MDFTNSQHNSNNDDGSVTNSGSTDDSSVFSGASSSTSTSASTGTGNDDMNHLQQEIAQLSEQLAAADQKLQEMTAISQRALADLQNFKRRTEEERATLFTMAHAQLFSELIPAFNNIHRALQHEPKDAEWIKGTEQTLRQLLQITEKIGLKPIETVGKPFDPRLHEALLTGPGPKDTVIEEFEKGYQLNDKVVQLAKVKVGNGDVQENVQEDT